MLDLTGIPRFAFAPDYWPEPLWSVLFVVFFWLVYFLHIFNRAEVPTVVVSEGSPSVKKGRRLRDVLERCGIFNEKYNPPYIWGRNGHIQTATYGVLGHSTLKRSYDKRHALRLPDGSTVLFDVFEAIIDHPAGEDVTLALCPGIANTSESNYIRTLVHYAQENGYRCAVLNHLGALKDVAITGNRIFNYGSTEELEAMMARLMDLYPTTKFISVGFSMGANITTRYLAKVNPVHRNRILIGLSVCQGYCALSSSPLYHEWENGRRVYNFIITENMKRLLRRNYARAIAPYVESGLVDEQRLWGATSFLVLDEVYSRRVWGFDDVESYYREVSCLHLIPDIQTPMVFLNSKDDPIVPEVLYRPVKEMCAHHPRHAWVGVAHGGHLGFLEGKSVYPASVTWLDRFIVQLADGAVQVFDDHPTTS